MKFIYLPQISLIIADLIQRKSAVSAGKYFCLKTLIIIRAFEDFIKTIY